MVKKKIIISSLSCLVALVLIAVGILSNGYKDWKLRDWFDHDTPLIIGYDDNGNELIDGAVYPLGSSMSFKSIEPMSTSAPTSIVVEVQPTPIYAVNAKIDWAVEWTGTDIYTSGWSQSKNVSDYVSVTPATDGSYTATVSYKASFGREILVRASVRGNSAVKSECVVRCIGNVVNLNLQAVVKGKSASPLSVSSAMSQTYAHPYRGGNYSEYTHTWATMNLNADTYTVGDWFLTPNIISKNDSVFTPSFSAPCTVTQGFTYTAKLKYNNAFLLRLGAVDDNLVYEGSAGSCDLFEPKATSNWYLFGFGMVSAMQFYGAGSSYYEYDTNPYRLIEKMRDKAVTIIDIPIFKLELSASDEFRTFTREINIYLNPSWTNNPAALSLDESVLNFW